MCKLWINILCVQKSKWVGEKAKDIDGYKLGYTSKVSHMNGVGIIVDEIWKKNVIEVYRSGERLLSIKIGN